ncbi:hypothetical protein B488_02360 [Liberibacter crescens BT-1]|uniref:DUF2093 domain-containing protein n=1 Tax=Liberibacter crescens (strain BT-1) TaxID=1215343 RepID=L0ERV5_LIBCB|nr:DUF2093 domain-containing protein [Liberibacter crescens]AGA64229.1 hypothetical protein B488_02360 [Liberibacter crescens BT-1]AMC12474.1 hypothetical protein RL73_01345 [Liberibacter crescens]
MNVFNSYQEREAKLHYMDGNFKILSPGTFVICAITGKRIPLHELCYWSVARQAPYADAAASLEAEKRAGTLPY